MICFLEHGPMSFLRLVSPKACSGLGGLALAVILTSTGAQAADYLRGAYGGHHGVEPVGAPQNGGVDWAGVYVGGHVGVSNVNSNSSRFNSTLVQGAQLPNTTLSGMLTSVTNFRNVDKRGTSLGVFAGANYLWDDVMLGVEADYSRSNANSSSQIGPYTSTQDTGGSRWTLQGSASARARVESWGTFRGRVGWAAGSFMPYLTAGVALGSIDGRATTSGTWQQANPALAGVPVVASGTYSARAGRESIAYGGALGAGVDVSFFSNMFVRAEWQHIQFASNNNRPPISMHTARVAGGVKF
jgi:outer membrane immunogenic protein